MPHVAQTLEVEEGKKKSGRYNFISFKKKNRLGGVVRGEVWGGKSEVAGESVREKVLLNPHDWQQGETVRKKRPENNRSIHQDAADWSSSLREGGANDSQSAGLL